MSGLGGQVLCGSSLDEIVTSRCQIWTCVITIVTVDSAAPISRGADKNGGVSKHIYVGIGRALRALRAKV